MSRILYLHLYHTIDNMKMRRHILNLIILFFTYLFFIQCNTAKTKDNTEVVTEEISEQELNQKLRMLIEDTIQSLSVQRNDTENFSTWQDAIKAVYQKNDYAPIWVNKQILNENGNAFFYYLANAELHALIKEKYNYEAIKLLKDSLEHLLPEFNFQLLRNLDISMSKAFLQVALHLDEGIYDEKKKTLNLNFYGKEEQYADLIKTIAVQNNPIQLLEQLEPQHPMFKRFKNAVFQYVSKNNIYPKKITVRNIKTDSIGAINDARLALTYHHYLHDTLMYNDSAYLSALKAFQRDQGYNPDGIVGNMTARALERDNSQKFMLLLINIDRWRSYKSELKPTSQYVWINLPSYKLRVINDDALLLEKNVIIGKAGGRTESPVLVSAINRIVLWPTWTVPQSIIKNEMKSFDGYIVSKNNGYTSVVQPPGLNNSLGAIKILFPNKYAVYVHDTPSKYLFKSDYRSYSHGCIRCQDPFEVAALIMKLSNFGMDYDSLIRLKEKKIQTRNFDLKKTIPIYIQYFTAEADWNGNLKYYADVYKKDSSLIATIFGRTDIVLNKPTKEKKLQKDTIFTAPLPEIIMDRGTDALLGKEDTIYPIRDTGNTLKNTEEPF